MNINHLLNDKTSLTKTKWIQSLRGGSKKLAKSVFIFFDKFGRLYKKVFGLLQHSTGSKTATINGKLTFILTICLNRRFFVMKIFISAFGNFKKEESQRTQQKGP